MAQAILHARQGPSMSLIWWKSGKRSYNRSSGRSVGSLAAAKQGMETRLQAHPLKYQVGGGEVALGAVFLFAGMYVFP